MQKNDEVLIEEDEIDLKELFKTIWESKKIVATFTLIVTIISIIYVVFKNPIPMYKGTLLVEIGEIKIEKGLLPIDNTTDLKYILETEPEIEVIVPKRTKKLIQIEVKGISKKLIKEKINSVYQKIIDKQNVKLKMYKEFIPTKKISDIVISSEPINKPKKIVIVMISFVIGLIVSIFLIFFMRFINSINEENK